MDFIRSVEDALGKKAKLNLLPMQQGDVSQTWASTERMKSQAKYQPSIALKEGIQQFVEWYAKRYKLQD